MKKILLSLMAVLMPLLANADTQVIGGICYNLVKKTQKAEVTSKPNNDYYTGEVNIPSTVEYDGITYTVTSIENGAFYKCSGLTSVTIPNSVTSIGTDENYVDGVFESCNSLTSVTIGSGVTSIGRHAFSWCSSLTSIDLPNSLTYIAQDVFDGCTGLTSVIIPNSVTYIGRGAFAFCSSLTSVTIPNSVTSIESVFVYCSSLTSVTIPNSVTSISDAFRQCSSLTSVTIPNSVTSIGGSAFQECSSLTSVTIPNSVTSIDDYAFDGCTDLTSVTIPNSVTSIGQYAFRNCSSLTSVTIGNGVKLIGNNAFAQCADLEDVYCYVEELSSTYLSGGPLYTNTNAFDDSMIEYAKLHVPSSSISDYSSIEPWSHFGTIVALPSPNIDFADGNVKTLCVANWDTGGDGELSPAEAAAVTNLGTVFTSKTVITSFDELQYFTGLSSINSDAFEGCTSLTSVTIPNNVTSIGGNAFGNCSSLTSITIPSSVTSIGSHAFYNCGGLNYITVETGNSIYDSRNNCNAIIESSSNKLIRGSNNTVIPNTVEAIDDAAFSYCSGLTSVTIPEGVTSIGSEAFVYTGLTSVHIPKSVTSIAILNPFLGCSSLSSITVDSENTAYDSRNNCNAINIKSSNILISGCKNTIIPNTIVTIDDQAFNNNTGITSINIPESVKNINSVAFANCTNLSSITFTDGLLNIRWNAFAGCTSLTSVTIPSTVTTIAGGVFDDCTNLTTVTVEIANPVSISASTFSNRANATLYVPTGSVPAYTAADYWKEFKEIKEIPATVSITLAKAQTTYCYDQPLNFTGVSGIRAYVASGFNPTTGTLLLMHVDEVPANTGLLLKGTAGQTYEIPVEDTDFYYLNMFKGVLSGITLPKTSDGYNNYFLKDGVFCLSDGTATIGANKAYLRLPVSTASARAVIYYETDDGYTGVMDVMEDRHESEDVYYNLNGQRVDNPKKGLYIQNGKKVVIK